MAKQSKSTKRRKGSTAAKARRPAPKKALVAQRVKGLSPSLLTDVRELIAGARGKVAVAVNAELTWLYWQIGSRIRQDILQQQRAAYGHEIVSALGTQLRAEFGPGFAAQTLRHMVRFAEAFPERSIVSALRIQFSWTHIRSIIYLPDPLQRDFYLEMCRIERWSTRTLRDKIQSMLYERTAISRKPAAQIRKELSALRAADQVTPDLVFRDPYVLDFLGLADTFAEKDLETAITRDLEHFLLELGTDFSFVARQKRIVVDGEDYYLDLLFYHRRLRRLVAIDLKLGRFQAGDRGQMELYLRWLARHERRPGEETPIGLILCAGKSDEHVELMELEKSGIRVGAYLTELPPKALLERKLSAAIKAARAQLESAPRRLPARSPAADAGRATTGDT